MIRILHHRIDGAQATTGKVLSIEEWAQHARIPHRKREGVLSGAEIEHILGIRSKSWDPALFRDPTLVVEIAASALASAAMRPDEVDAAIVVTCTPYEVLLDQDSFRLLRMLGIPDHVVPIQCAAGCAGLARAMWIASQLDARNVLILAYNLPSLITEDEEGRLSSLYRTNTVHPMGEMLWTSPAIFSDAAAALVVRRTEAPTGIALYSRDSQRLGDEPGFTDPLIHVLGGGAKHPLTKAGGRELMSFGMAGEHVKRYYTAGMMRNHHSLNSARPGYVRAVKRIYTHQASPALIEDFTRRAELPSDKTPTNAARLGNLVTPCTIQLFHDDLLSGAAVEGDELCFSVVGAGPERGAFILPVGPIAAKPFARSPQPLPSPGEA
jgi:3-oxoacyl-[acyl-carrier-protein] synthase-3